MPKSNKKYRKTTQITKKQYELPKAKETTKNNSHKIFQESMRK